MNDTHLNSTVEGIPFATEVVADAVELFTPKPQQSQTTTIEKVATNHEASRTPISLPITLFVRNGFSEAEALASIRELGTALDQFAHRNQFDAVEGLSLSDFITKDLVEARLFTYDSRKDLTSMERIVLKNLYSVLISPNRFPEFLDVVQCLGFKEVFETILLTYFAGGFRTKVAEKHVKIAAHYGCRWEELVQTHQNVLEQDQWQKPTWSNFHDEKKCYYCVQDADLRDEVSREYASKIYAHSKKIGKGHIAIACDVALVCSTLFCFPLFPFICIDFVNGLGQPNPKITVDKGILNDEVGSANSSFGFCNCVHYDPMTDTETFTETKRVCSWETIVVASPPCAQGESLSDQFIAECRLIFAEAR
jgi:hypothetical protein